MKHHEGTFDGVKFVNLYYQNWHPQGQTRAILIIIHGLGGHSGLYANIINHLIPKNYAVYSFDLRGHGQSPGQRGYINSWDDFRQDLQAFVQLITNQQGEKPYFLLGHSLGGVIVLDYILHFPQIARELKGAIALAPSIGKVGIPGWKLLLGKFLSRIFPSFSLSTGMKADAASRDEKVVAAYIQDPLRHTRGTARLATEYLQTVAAIRERVSDIHTPLLIMHGGADTIAQLEGSLEFFHQVTFADKQWREYPETYHEIQSDINYPEVLKDMEDWLEQHLIN
ncbi:Lysophospholipase; Monoglyceride lipase; putative [Richelia intracellularis]|nr:Lysophospholipase; Monoglyceride lipase; putative [Richelia intracellularis]